MKGIFVLIFCSLFLGRGVAQLPVGNVPSATVKNGQTVYVTELVGGKQLWRKITIASLNTFLGDSVKAEIYPNRVTNIFDNNNALALRNKMVQTVDSLIYFVDYKGNSILLGANGTAQNDAVTVGGAQTVTGKKRFADTVLADNGLKSNGLIQTKGLNTEGSLNAPAATINGVQKVKRRLITQNAGLDGNDFFLEVACQSGDITIVLPVILDSDGWVYDIKRTDNTAFVVRFQRPDGSFIRILNRRSVTLRNSGTQWLFD